MLAQPITFISAERCIGSSSRSPVSGS